MENKQEKTLIESLADQLMNRELKVLDTFSFGDAGLEILDNGAVYYLSEGQRIRPFHSRAKTAEGTRIDTRTAKYKGTNTEEITDALGNGLVLRSRFSENGLVLIREVILRHCGALTVQVKLEKKNGAKVRTRFLAPLDAPYPDKTGKRLFLSLDQKMLLVPYDNDMWTRYESAVPRPGRTSYDVTAIYDEDSFQGLVVGAVDFTLWKNAISWAAHDARAFVAFSGAADAATHDILPHGIVSGESVSSARFWVKWTEDIREGMVDYANQCVKVRPARPWSGGAIFGWNSFSALGMGLRLSHWEEAGKFFHEEIPNFSDNGVSYINLDACFGMSKKEIRRIVGELHSRGQKAGWYAAPCVCIPVLAKIPVPGTLTPLENLILKDSEGRPLPPADGSYPLDVTHPLWEKYARSQIRNVLELGFDYIKLDFLSHGGVEGHHHRPEFTGRMALDYAYRVIEDEISRAGREIFVSLSIAPIFPYHLGNARRCCCDSFGHMDDTRYVLNALNFGWWQNGILYRFSDPDHLALQHSVIDGREETTESEARARYLSGLISGTLMILSDNYGPQGDPQRIAAARERTKKLANDPRLNEIAKIGKAFIPVDLGSDTTSFYTLSHVGKHYVAVFNYSKAERLLSFPALRGNLPQQGRAVSLVSGRALEYSGDFAVTVPGWDADIFEIA